MNTARAFTLIEALIVVAIMAIVATITFSDSLEAVIRKKVENEDQALALIERDIRASFENPDFSETNIASLDKEIGSGDLPTTFSTSTNPSYTNTSKTDWFAKVARIRGTSVDTSKPPTRNQQPELSRILYNSTGHARLLVAHTQEQDKQRFMLISLMAHPDELSMPAYDGSDAWFDAIWNTDFTNRAQRLPNELQTSLTREQVDQWNGDTSGTNLYHLRVKRITLPRYTITINNNHPSKAAWISANGGQYNLMSAANSGSITSTRLLGGRQIRVTCGDQTQPGTAQQTHLFLLREDAIIDVDSR